MPPLKNRDRAAKIVGVGSRYVSDAETIKKESPDIFDQVKSGEKTLSQAKRMAEESKARKSAVLKISKIEVQSDTNVLWGDSFKLAESIANPVPTHCCRSSIPQQRAQVQRIRLAVATAMKCHRSRYRETSAR